MQKATGLRIVALLAVLSVILVLGCTSGVAQKDYDAAKQQVATQEQELAKVRQQLTAKEQEVAKLQQEIAARGTGGGTGPAAEALRQQLTAKEKEVTDLQKSLAQLQGAKPLIWTQLLPTPAPRPTATPVPPGYVAPPAPTPPPELVNEVVPFTFYVETLTGHQVTTVAQFPGCVPNSQFRRGSHMAWRFEVFDTSTGKRITGLDTGATIKLVLPNGEENIARYSKRGGTGPWMWVAAYTIPFDYPLGTFDYQIVVTKGGRTGTFDQDKVALVRAATATAAGIDSRVQIVE
jgi:outer membrane murein-binding lipoprotein Lpp